MTIKKIYSPVLRKKNQRPDNSVSPQTSFKPLAFRSQSISRSPASFVTLKLKTNEIFQPKAVSTFEAWKLAKGLAKTTKIFAIQGNYPELKQNFLDRGWVENPDSKSMNFNFLWTLTGKFPKTLENWQIINHFPLNVEISAKWNFCENIKKIKSKHKVNYLSFFPRAFRLTGKETDEFKEYFKVTKACAVLKQFIESQSQNQNLNVQGLYEKTVTAISILKRWAVFLEKNVATANERFYNFATKSEWKILELVRSFDIQIEFKKSFAGKNITPPSGLLAEATELSEKLKKLDPQYAISGSKNIWIVKPGSKSRGREIALFDDLQSITKYTQNPKKWVVQKYIENPLLVSRKKFDIRQWVLVTSSSPLVIWIYNSCYLRFAVEDYAPNNLLNVYMHLTNNSISKSSYNFKNSEIEGCMWDSLTFQEFLKEKHGFDAWADRIFPRIKEIVKWSLLAVGDLGRKNSFEVLGYDFMVDDQLNSWLIEVNSSPAMDYSTVRGI